jgi:hypothetical protein
LIDLATSKGLDPFHPDTWHKITWKDIRSANVCLKLQLYNEKIICGQGAGISRVLPYRKAVADAFPEIEFGQNWTTKGSF